MLPLTGTAGLGPHFTCPSLASPGVPPFPLLQWHLRPLGPSSREHILPLLPRGVITFYLCILVTVLMRRLRRALFYLDTLTIGPL